MSSLKIERDTFQTAVTEGAQKTLALDNHRHSKVAATAAAISEAASGNLPGTKGDHPISAVVGTALTGGRQNAGTKGYLAVRSPLFRSRPRLTRFRPTSSNWRKTRCGPRCSLPVPSRVLRS